LLLVSQRNEVGRLPDIDEPVYVITRVVLLPLNDMPVKDLDIMVCCIDTVLLSDICCWVNAMGLL